MKAATFLTSRPFSRLGSEALLQSLGIAGATLGGIWLRTDL
jgi:hypothetical protein